MRIAIDLDGVCYNFTASLAGYIEHMTGERFSHIPSCWEFYQTDWGMSLDEYLHWFNEGVQAGWVFSLGAPYPEVVEALTQLRAEGHTIHLITERNIGGNRAKLNTIDWLDAYEIPYDTLTFSTGNKSDIVKVDIAVDDRPKNVDEWDAAGVPVYCMNFDEREDVRAHWAYIPYDWDNFIDLVHTHEASEFDTSEFIPMTVPWDNFIDAVPHVQHVLDGMHGEVRITDPDTGGQKGSKLARFDLIPPRPLWKLAEHYGAGAAKYSERNWELGYDWKLSFAAMQRHSWAFWNEAELDGSPYEGDEYHLAAIAFHAFALQQFTQTHPEKDTRHDIGS